MKINYTFLLSLFLLLFSSCSEDEGPNSPDVSNENPIAYDQANSMIENTLTIDWSNSNYSDTSINLESGIYNDLFFETDYETTWDDNGDFTSTVLGYKYLNFISKDSNGNSIFKMTVGRIWGSDYLEEGVIYDLSSSENFKDVIVTYYGSDGNPSIIFSANYHKNTVYDINGLGTFKILNLNMSDDNNDMNDIVEVEFNDVHVYDAGVELKFSGILKANVR